MPPPAHGTPHGRLCGAWRRPALTHGMYILCNHSNVHLIKTRLRQLAGKSATRRTLTKITTKIERLRPQEIPSFTIAHNTIAKMLAARRQAQQSMLPYRDDSGAVRYAPAPDALHETRSILNDDSLPLITNAAYLSQEDGESDPTQRFTATGGPMPAYRPSVYVSMNMYSAPQHLPQKYTDESIIPVVIQVPDPLAGQ